MNDHVITGDVWETLEATCLEIAAGKLASQRLKQWIRDAALNETEFRLLLTLRQATRVGSASQTQLAVQLAVSPALISATVERLRLRQLVAPVVSSDDRRRQAWQLTASARHLLARVASDMGRGQTPSREAA